MSRDRSPRASSKRASREPSRLRHWALGLVPCALWGALVTGLAAPFLARPFLAAAAKGALVSLILSPFAALLGRIGAEENVLGRMIVGAFVLGIVAEVWDGLEAESWPSVRTAAMPVLFAGLVGIYGLVHPRA